MYTHTHEPHLIPVGCNVFVFCSHRVFDLYPAQKDFSVDVIIEEYDYGRTDGSEVWRTKGTLHVGPNQRVVKSEELTVCELPRLASFLYWYILAMCVVP